VGRCAIFVGGEQDTQYGFASYLIRVRLDLAKMRPQYLAFFLNSTHGRTEIDQRRRTSAGQFNINSENLRSIKVPCPPVEVQDQVVRELADRQAAVVELQQRLADTQSEASHLRESILRKAFAGEL
jgi:type I restriction enzyme S subunit